MEGKNSVCGFLGGSVHLGASAPVMRVPFPRGDDLPRATVPRPRRRKSFRDNDLRQS